jgi:hypothetical protein
MSTTQPNLRSIKTDQLTHPARYHRKVGTFALDVQLQACIHQPLIKQLAARAELI